MLKITLGVDGMMCGMCESHVNDAVRKAFPVKKVTSSHGKGQTVEIAGGERSGVEGLPEHIVVEVHHLVKPRLVAPAPQEQA